MADSYPGPINRHNFNLPTSCMACLLLAFLDRIKHQNEQGNWISGYAFQDDSSIGTRRIHVDAAGDGVGYCNDGVLFVGHLERILLS